MHSNDNETKIRDLSTSSQSSTEDLMATGVNVNHIKQKVMALTSDETQQHIYEDIDLRAPPKLAPSGVYTKGKTVLKPIAFKPVMTSAFVQQSRFGTPGTGGSSPFSSIDSNDMNSNPENMNKTSSKSALSQSQYSLSQHSFFLEDDNWYSEIAALKLAETSGLLSIESINQHEATYDIAAQTPSPSDSGVAELEAMLREKDSEISYLRETLEHNEQVIFKVYEEKEQAWQREFKKLRSFYDSKLRTSQLKLEKAEQALHSQTQHTAVEKKKFNSDLETEKRNNEDAKNQVKQLEAQLSLIRTQLEETEWSLCQKIGEISLLKAQLKESQDEQSLRFSELVSMKTKLKDMKIVFQQKSQQVLELEEKLSNSHHNSLEPLIYAEKSMESLQAQLTNILSERQDKNNVIERLKNDNFKLQNMVTNLQDELDRNKEQIEEEKIVWMEEKEKVIKYQKQLQKNYMQMFRKNKNLEQKLQQVTGIFSIDQQSDSNETQC